MKFINNYILKRKIKKDEKNILIKYEKYLIKELNIFLKSGEIPFLIIYKITKLISFDKNRISTIIMTYGKYRHSLETNLELELKETNDKIRSIIRSYYREIKLNRLKYKKL